MARRLEPPHPYPPCQSDPCDFPSCCAPRWGGGPKYTWPELVGKKAEEAKAVIESQYKIGTVYILPPLSVEYDDFCCNRIRVYVDKNDVVIKPPIVG